MQGHRSNPEVPTRALLALPLCLALAQPAFAQDANTSTIEQIGDGNAVEIAQTYGGEALASHISQMGSGNHVITTQYGPGSRSISTVSQKGTSNFAVIAQIYEDSTHSSMLAQAGEGDRAIIAQGGHGSEYTSAVTMDGTFNTLTSRQLNTEFGKNDSVVAIGGNRNEIFVTQQGFQADNRASLSVTGDDNFVEKSSSGPYSRGHDHRGFGQSLDDQSARPHRIGRLSSAARW
jgi:hypothetical protein